MNEINEKDYIIMELLGEDMGTLRQISRQQINDNGYLIQLPIAIHLAKEMINCIEYLHHKGYIHRDIKPANFVQRLDNPLTYCIIDFGITKLVRTRIIYSFLSHSFFSLSLSLLVIVIYLQKRILTL